MNFLRALPGRLAPKTLFARLTLILLAGLAAAQLLSAVQTIDERDDVNMGVMIDTVEIDLGAAVALLDRLPRAEREAWLPRLGRRGFQFLAGAGEDGPPVRAELSTRLLRSATRALAPGYPFSANEVPGAGERFQVHVRLGDGDQVSIDFRPRPGLPLSPWLPYVLAGQLLLVALSCWVAVRLATAPLRALADAADALGPDLRPAEMPERGPSEVVRATRALNAMQRRISAYVDERLRILAAISHDLQTPITRMRLRIDMMDDGAQQQRLSDHLRDDLLQLQDLVREGLDYARAMHGKPETACPTDLCALLDSIVLDYRDGGAAVRFEGLGTGSGAAVRTRPRALRRIVGNLVDNALKYAGDAEVVLDFGHPDRAVIRVLDHGPGIPDAMLDAVFEPFYRLEGSRNRETGGSGLGLAIARQLATALPGELTLHNRSEGGLEARLVVHAA
jgi:signal transduction histidine kinase